MTEPAKRKAAFLDRDGTLIEYEKEPVTEAHIRPYPFAAAAVRRLNDLGYLVIVHTNQPVIEKGVITQAQADALNEYLRREFEKSGARIDGFYTCPHRYVEGREDRCRKPEIGLIEAAERDFPVDRAASWLVGDTTRDMETGKRAGMRSILVMTGKAGGGEDAKFFPARGDFEATDLGAAVRIIEREDTR
jgi:histidinol-phosphate phosphatase family protein